MTESQPLVNIIFITFNRLYYTKITLPKLLACNYKNYRVTIVDNGSTDGTTEYLKSLKNSKIDDIIFNKKNKGLVKPTKKFWNKSYAKFVGKIDNDIIVPPNFIDVDLPKQTDVLIIGSGYTGPTPVRRTSSISCCQRKCILSQSRRVW